MFRYLLLAAFGLLQAVNAHGPSSGDGNGNGNGGSTGVQHNADFDDLQSTLPVALFPVDDYEGLNWNGVVVVPVLNGVTITTPSPPNVIGYGIISELEEGEFVMTPLADGSTFDLHSFYLACVVVNAVTVASLPISCTVTITAYNQEEVIGTQVVEFTPTGLTSTNMAFVEVDQFSKHATKIHMETANDLLIGTLLDNVEYTTYPVGSSGSLVPSGPSGPSEGW